MDLAKVDFSPPDDHSVECIIRMWGRQVHIFMHPIDWKQVSVRGGTPMRINCRGVNFPCRIRNLGEHYRGGTAENIAPEDFDARPCDDHWGTAWIDWEAVIPDLVREAMVQSPDVLAAWRKLSLDEMRGRLSYIYQARTAGSQADRQLALVRALAEGPD